MPIPKNNKKPEKLFDLKALRQVCGFSLSNLIICSIKLEINKKIKRENKLKPKDS